MTPPPVVPWHVALLKVNPALNIFVMRRIKDLWPFDLKIGTPAILLLCRTFAPISVLVRVLFSSFVIRIVQDRRRDKRTDRWTRRIMRPICDHSRRRQVPGV